MNDSADNSDYDALYTIPITQLCLDTSTIARLQAADVTSIGDLVAVCQLLRYATVSMASDMMAIYNGEVKEKLEEYGYWSYVVVD